MILTSTYHRFTKDIKIKRLVIPMKMSSITLIAAVDNNFAIGSKGSISWMGEMKSDMKHFISKTSGKPVIMGRKTFDSIGFPLKNRLNIVLTKSTQFKHGGVTVAHTIDEAVSIAGSGDIMIIGGAEIYKEFMGIADRIILTHIDTQMDEPDAFFPELNKKEWVIADTVDGHCDADNVHNHSFVTYERT